VAVNQVSDRLRCGFRNRLKVICTQRRRRIHCNYPFRGNKKDCVVGPIANPEEAISNSLDYVALLRRHGRSGADFWPSLADLRISRNACPERAQ